MAFAVFILSTGRCGTQWLAQMLRSRHGDGLRVEHEPLHNRYQPRAMLGARDPHRLEPALARPILEHIADIERTLEERNYIETGHPCWSTIPYLAERLRGRIRIVHLVRHPVPTAYSWWSHGAFVPPWLPHLTKKELILPGDAGAAFPEYAARWDTLHPFEKCLYYWGEVNAFGLAGAAGTGAPWLRLQYEALFEGAGLAVLLEFLQLPPSAVPPESVREHVDQFRYCLGEWIAPEAVQRHPRVLGLAAQLGYDLSACDARALRQRYQPGAG